MDQTTALSARGARGRRSSRLSVFIVAALAATLLAVPSATASGAVTSGASAHQILAAPAVTTARTIAAKKRVGWRPKQGAVFNIARGTMEQKLRIERQVVSAIQRARKGSYIKMVMFSFDRWEVANALIAAKKRGVRVQVITNEHEITPAQVALYRALGGRYGKSVRYVKVPGKKKKKKVVRTYKKRNFWFQCRSACRGDLDIQHSKFILFSQTGVAKNVVMLGSANMKWNGIDNQFNDWLTLNEKPGIYDYMSTIFEQMRADKTLKNSHQIKSFANGKYEIEVLPFPRRLATKKTRYTPARDPIIRLLRPVQCTGANNTSDGRTMIRVAMHAWDGKRGGLIARRLRELYAQGCNVMINVGFAGPSARAELAVPTRRGVVPVRSTGFDTPNVETTEENGIDLYTHEKTVLIRGNYGGKKRTKMVITGSSNFQDSGWVGDELVFSLKDNAIYKQYAEHWAWMWKYQTHGFTWSQTYNRGTGLPEYTLTSPVGNQTFDWRQE